jgi:hypothetical protein
MIICLKCLVNILSKLLRSPWGDVRNRGDLDNAKNLYSNNHTHGHVHFDLASSVGPMEIMYIYIYMHVYIKHFEGVCLTHVILTSGACGREVLDGS